MEKRRFGRSGHMSTVAIFGAAAFWQIEQDAAEQVMDEVTARGINHIDVAPSYGQAELRLGPWLKSRRDRFFLGCKTQIRDRAGAAAELRNSLKLLHTDRFDLFQIHAVTSMDELDAAMGRGGSLEAILEAKAQGLTQYVGITGHGVDSPAVFREALRRYDFDSVLFPINYVQFANPYYRENALALLAECQAKDVGVMVIKSITRAPWGERPKTANTWYEPFAQAGQIQTAVNFVLSQAGVTGLCTAGDVGVLPLVLDACERFTPLAAEAQAQLVEGALAEGAAPLFV